MTQASAILLALGIAGTVLAAPQQSEPAARDQLARFAASYATAEQWQARAAANRAGILRGAGLLPAPDKCPLRPIIHSRRTYDGYTVESVAFESLPGFYATGSLYRPTKAEGRCAAILCPHGHFNDPKTHGHGPNDQGGRFNPELQKLPATLARLGAIAFAYDMVGWSDSTQTTHDDPNVLALQLWNSIRTVDFLLSLKGVDPKRLGMTGASGGGTQTMMLTAVDDRIAAAAPVVMVSAHFFGGCQCESGLPIHQSATHETNNADISAMAAPRPQLIVSCGADWTKNVPVVEFPYIRNVYRLFHAEDRIANVHLAAEGHDYGPSKRQAVYKFFAQYLKLSLAATNETGLVSEDIPTMRVFNDQHPRPATAIQGPAQTAAALRARAADNILSWQSDHGSWPKNTDTSAKPYTGDRAKLQGTFDNGATTGELRYLARTVRATGDPRYRQAFLRGLDAILQAQYPTGGWPQYYPPPAKSYHRHITFNDNAMVRLMELLRDVATAPDYEFVDADRRRAAQQAFDHGVECILKCQVVVNGKPTVWCAQHDEQDYRPRPARSYELVSLSGGESAGILALLMSLDHPNPAVIRAVTAGAEWYDSAKLSGIRQITVNGDKRVIQDPDAPPVWARFYEIETNRPIFCGRDGVKKYDLSQIEAERRNGYAWYGDWGARVARDYAKWKDKWLTAAKP